MERKEYIYIPDGIVFGLPDTFKAFEVVLALNRFLIPEGGVYIFAASDKDVHDGTHESTFFVPVHIKAASSIQSRCDRPVIVDKVIFSSYAYSVMKRKINDE